jgi:adenosylmethionine-8-amino-7-oxononanoate aminotransferase
MRHLAERLRYLAPRPAQRTGKRVILEARKRGIILRPLGDVIVLMPPLSSTEEEIRRLGEVVAASIEAATQSATTPK